MHLLFRGRLKLLAASLVAAVLLTWLYLLAGNLESEFNRDVAIETNIKGEGVDTRAAANQCADQPVISQFNTNNEDILI